MVHSAILSSERCSVLCFQIPGISDSPQRHGKILVKGGAAREARATHANFFGRRELMAGEHRQQKYGGRR
jgi:hypothetical protein